MDELIESVRVFAESTLAAFVQAQYDQSTPECVQAWYLHSMLKGSISLLDSYKVLRSDCDEHMGLSLIARSLTERLFKASYAQACPNKAVCLMILEAKGELDKLEKWTRLQPDAGVEPRMRSIKGDLDDLLALADPAPHENEKFNLFKIAEEVSMDVDYRTAYSHFSKAVHGMYISDGSNPVSPKLVDWYSLISLFGCATFLAELVGNPLASAELLQDIQQQCR